MPTTTVKYEGIEFDVDYDYQPEEKMVRYYPDGSGYPGCPEELTINEISHKGTDFTDFFIAFDLMDGFEEAMWKQRDDRNGEE